MVRKADHNRALSGTALDPVKGALSLAPRRWRGVVLMCLMAWLAGIPGARFAVAESLGPAT
ncbi:MAG: hypothetical protein V3T62_10845, partial [Alphaproteobacteria bacterium]